GEGHDGVTFGRWGAPGQLSSFARGGGHGQTADCARGHGLALGEDERPAAVLGIARANTIGGIRQGACRGNRVALRSPRDRTGLNATRNERREHDQREDLLHPQQAALFGNVAHSDQISALRRTDSVPERSSPVSTWLLMKVVRLCVTLRLGMTRGGW